MRISLVLPAFNEEKRLAATLDDLIAYRENCRYELETIVVDDGSTDGTSELALSYRDQIPDLILVRHDSNRGKGRAVANGMLTGSGHYRAFFDADGATPFTALDDLVAATCSKPKAIGIGSVRAEGADVTSPQSRLRSRLGQAGNTLIRAVALPGVRDSQRGCKVFPARVAEIVFESLSTDRWGFDIEILARCRYLGYEIIEVPVEWRHVAGGQISASAYMSTLAEVVNIRRTIKSWDYPPDSVSERVPAPAGIAAADAV